MHMDGYGFHYRNVVDCSQLVAYNSQANITHKVTRYYEIMYFYIHYLLLYPPHNEVACMYISSFGQAVIQIFNRVNW